MKNENLEEVKIYRGKRIANNKWVVGKSDIQGLPSIDYLENNVEESVGYIVVEDSVIAVYEQTMGMKIDYCDITGKEIFQGDIVEVADAEGNKEEGEICIESGEAFIKLEDRKIYNFGGYNLRVTNNIHDGGIECSFCGRIAKEVSAMISGPRGSNICEECTIRAYSLLATRRK